MFLSGNHTSPICPRWTGNNYIMWEKKEPPKIQVAQKMIKKKSIIDEYGNVIRNTPEDPNAVERYLASKKK